MRRWLRMVGVVCIIGTALPASVEAGGLRGRCGGGGCATSGDCGQVIVGWEEREVTTYRCETKTATTPVTVNKLVHRVVEEPYKYVCLEPVTTQEKRTITTYRCVSKEVPTTWNVCVPVPAQEKRTITCYRRETKEVPYTYHVCIPTTVPEKRTVTVCRYEPQEVVRTVPVCRVVRKECVDPCTGCVRYTCHTVTEMKEVKCTVMKAIPETKEIVVNVCRYHMEPRQGTRTVCHFVPETKEVVVNVCRYETQQRTGTRIVQERIPETKEVLVDVCSYRRVEKDGVRRRLVCETVPETVNVTKCWVERVPVTTKVKVPVYGPAPGCGPVAAKPSN